MPEGKKDEPLAPSHKPNPASKPKPTPPAPAPSSIINDTKPETAELINETKPADVGTKPPESGTKPVEAETKPAESVTPPAPPVVREQTITEQLSSPLPVETAPPLDPVSENQLRYDRQVRRKLRV
jgi:hypothetical protein